MSEVKVNKISPRSGTTVTLGDSGDTFTIPSGATINNQGTATNFGATGSASWVTTVKTGDFTAVAGEGYFVNTTSGAINVTLPAGTPGAVVAIKDYADTFDTNTVTLVRNGSDKIGGSAINATLGEEGIAVTLVFVDSTQGWLVTDSGLQSEAPTAQFITATGGTITTVDTNFKVHTFTGPGTFTVCSTGNAAGSNTVSYVVIAGGGSGAANRGGGGGAGGYREGLGVNDSYAGAPTRNPTGVPVTAQGYPITVGSGGASVSSPPYDVSGNDGSNSIFSTITSTGGGGGGYCATGRNGGSGGGGSYPGPFSAGGSGNTPPVSPPQGNDGGTSSSSNSGSGGGSAGAIGGASSDCTAGNGGAGVSSTINGTPTLRAGGGGGSGNSSGGAAGPGGGGTGFAGTPGGSNPNDDATVNTGGGGGGSRGASSGAGGSGIVIIRYKFQ